jgi:protein O-GlcNAc transferase
MLGWLRSRINKHSGGTAEPPRASPVAATPPALLPQSLAERLQAEQYEEALDMALECTRADANDGEAWLAQAEVAAARRKTAAVPMLLAKALALSGHDAARLARAAGLYSAVGRKNEAARALKRALELDARCAEVQAEAGLTALRAGRVAEGEVHLRAATEARPPSAEAWFHLGNLQRERGRLVEAEQAYRSAVRWRPLYADAWNNLGSLLKDGGRATEAQAALAEAVRLRPGFAQARFNLGALLIDQQRYAEAAEHLRESIALDASQLDAHFWLGNACMALGDVEAARTAYRSALQIDRRHAKSRWAWAMGQLPMVPADATSAAAGVAAFREEWSSMARWIQAQPKGNAHLSVGSQQPFYLAYAPGDHREALAAYGGLCSGLMAKWAARIGVPAPAARSNGRLRLGIVSAHIHNHSVWNALVRGWVEHLDPKQFEIHLFHVGPRSDEQTVWARARAAAFHDGARDWADWAQTVSDTRMDVLVYPEVGMDSTTLRLASLRLARLQLAAWGHPISTGLPTIDGYLSAEAFEPEGAEAHYTERLIRLPRLGCCYRPFAISPASVDLAPFGVEPGDRLLICAGTPFKYGPEFDALWVAIARRCAPCKLLFFRSEPPLLALRLEQRIAAAFEREGLSFAEHAAFLPRLPQDQFFGLLARSHALLDSPGFSGFNTVMQAVECACPVVAWEGDALRSRFASGVLRQLGLDDWVCGDAASFADRAQRACDDPVAAGAMRRQIEAGRSALYGDVGAVAATADVLRNGVDRVSSDAPKVAPGGQPRY